MVTGANSGLGRAVAGALAGQGATVLMVCRDATRGEAARHEIMAATGNTQVHLFVADLASQAVIRGLAARVRERCDRLHLLINNAGTAFPARRLSPDGIEMALAVNHLAPFLLTNLLLEPLRAAAPARIVNVGTRINTAMDFLDLNWERRPYRLMQAYGQSKLGNLHFTFELARRLAGSGVTVNCCFPVYSAPTWAGRTVHKGGFGGWSTAWSAGPCRLPNRRHCGCSIWPLTPRWPVSQAATIAIVSRSPPQPRPGIRPPTSGYGRSAGR